MFCKTSRRVNLFATLLCFVAVLSTAAPVGHLTNTLAERELVPLVPGTQIQPPLVDLLDQFQNLQQTFDAASPDDPNFDALSKQLDDIKAKLDLGIKGVAVLVTSSGAALSNSVTSKTTTTTGAVSTTAPPSHSVITDVPVVTVVTQVGTSFVVLASQGVTRTVTLATITAVPSGPVSSPTRPVPPATGSGTPALVTSTRPATTGAAVNVSVQQTASAISMAPKSIVVTVLGGSLLGVMMVLL